MMVYIMMIITKLITTDFDAFSVATYNHLYYLMQDKKTPLHLACMYDKADVVNILLSHGAYVHAVDKVNKYVL